MSAAKPWIWIVGALGVLAACESHDRVLTPDPGSAGASGAAGSGAGSGGSAAGTSGTNGGSGAGAGGATGGSAGTASGGAAGVSTAGSGGASGGSSGGAAGTSSGGAGMSDAGPGRSADSGIADSGSDAPVDTSRPPTAQDADCDLNGIWIAQQVSVATAIGAAQYGNVWHYLEIEHNGADFKITKQFDCGGEVKGTLHVTLREVTTRSVMTHNRQVGRRGAMKKNSAGGCDLAFERFWAVRGAVEASFIPAGGRNSMADMTQVQADRPLPKAATPMGAEDWDGDMHQGIGWDVAGVVTGRRHSVQRDWTSWFTDSAYPIAPALDWPREIMARAEVDIEDSVFDTEPAGNFLLASVATSDVRNANNRFIPRFLGRNASDPRVTAIPITGTDPDANPASALATCLAIQTAMPAKQAR